MMKKAHVSARVMGWWPLVMGLMIGVGPTGSSVVAQEKPAEKVAPPKLSEAERARRLQERDRHRAEANRLAESGKPEDVIRHIEAALVIEREVLGELSDDVADTLDTLAQWHEFRADWAAAHKARQDILSLRDRRPDRKDWRVSDARRALADLERRAGMTADQRRLLGRAEDLNALAGSEYAKGRYKTAEAGARESLNIREKLLGQDHPDYATSLNNLGMLYHDMGDYARAEPLYRRAMDIRKKALGEDQPDYAASLNNLGSLYQDMGGYARAEPLLRRAMDIRKKVLGEDQPNYAASLANLGGLYKDMGDHARAEPLLRRAMETYKKVVGADNPNYAASLANLGGLYKDMGDHARAEPLLRRAMEILKEAPGEDHPKYATSLNNLGMLYLAMGDYARAEPLLRGAMEIWKKVLGEYHPTYAMSLKNLGMLYGAMGDYTRAEPLTRSAMEICKKSVGEDHPDYARSLNNVGALYVTRGEYARAEPVVRRAMEIFRKALGEDHPDYAASLSNLGVLYLVIGDYARAAPLFKEALDRNTTLIRSTASAVGERQWLQLVKSLRDGLDPYASVALDTGASAQDLYRHVLDWKGAADARQSEARLSRDQPELKPVLEQLARTTGRLAQLAFASPSPAQRSAWRRQLDELSAGGKRTSRRIWRLKAPCIASGSGGSSPIPTRWPQPCPPGPP